MKTYGRGLWSGLAVSPLVAGAAPRASSAEARTPPAAPAAPLQTTASGWDAVIDETVSTERTLHPTWAAASMQTAGADAAPASEDGAAGEPDDDAAGAVSAAVVQPPAKRLRLAEGSDDVTAPFTSATSASVDSTTAPLASSDAPPASPSDAGSTLWRPDSAPASAGTTRRTGGVGQATLSSLWGRSPLTEPSPASRRPLPSSGAAPSPGASAATSSAPAARQTQSVLTLGQRDAGPIECSACGMLYHPRLAEDAALHARFCRGGGGAGGRVPPGSSSSSGKGGGGSGAATSQLRLVTWKGWGSPPPPVVGACIPDAASGGSSSSSSSSSSVQIYAVEASSWTGVSAPPSRKALMAAIVDFLHAELGPASSPAGLSVGGGKDEGSTTAAPVARTGIVHWVAVRSSDAAVVGVAVTEPLGAAGEAERGSAPSSSSAVAASTVGFPALPEAAATALLAETMTEDASNNASARECLLLAGYRHATLLAPGEAAAATDSGDETATAAAAAACFTRPLPRNLLGLAQVWVAPTYRRRGLARTLLDAATAHGSASSGAVLAFRQPTGAGIRLAAAYARRRVGGSQGEEVSKSVSNEKEALGSSSDSSSGEAAAPAPAHPRCDCGSCGGGVWVVRRRASGGGSEAVSKEGTASRYLAWAAPLLY